MNCQVCDSQSKLLFKKKVLKKYDVSYFQCGSCDFLQTEEPTWLDEAYSSAIQDTDIGLIFRNNIQRDICYNVFLWLFNDFDKGIDYGGGYGMFVRNMRDLGFDFYAFDKFCENLFSKEYVLDSLGGKYTVVTAFEVMEHVKNPAEVIGEVLQSTDNFLFSTELQPATKLEDWWYVAPEHGQHISFYSKKSLESLAAKLNINYYSNGHSIHLFSKKKRNRALVKLLLKYRARHVFNFLNIFRKKPASLLITDHQRALDQSK